jgi:hypothetical protein
MSGGSSAGIGPAPGPDSSSCDLIEDTQVQSPDPDVSRDLRVDQELTVSLISGPRSRLEAHLGDRVVGGLIPRSLARIIRCIRDEGCDYVAVVRSINGADIRVRIRLAQ